MNESRPLTRLDMLRFTRRVVEQQAVRQLALIDRWIADEERREAERQRGIRTRLPAPEWLMERGIGQGAPVTRIHQGGCHMAKGVRVKGITEEVAKRALYADIELACPHCNPDTALRVIPG
ncbi:DUF6233 domain-containing protein [Streptomyces griseoincarnatus]